MIKKKKTIVNDFKHDDDNHHIDAGFSGEASTGDDGTEPGGTQPQEITPHDPALPSCYRPGQQLLKTLLLSVLVSI